MPDTDDVNARVIKIKIDQSGKGRHATPEEVDAAISKNLLDQETDLFADDRKDLIIVVREEGYPFK